MARRSGRGRSRTGCANCRLRHLKCDESRPSCTRCCSSGRRCDGYDFSLSRLKLKQWKPLPIRSNHESPKQSLVSFRANPTQRYYFELFRNQMPSRFSSIFNSALWMSTMLQACHAEASILNILVAISASLGSELVPVSESVPSSSILYGQALSETRRLISQKDPAIQTTVLCCIGLVTLEVLRFQYYPALVHLENCIKLIRANGCLSESTQSVLNREIFQGLMDFDYQASQYVAGRAPMLLTDSVPLHDLNLPSPDVVTDAFVSLETLSRRFLGFTRIKGDTYRSTSLGQVPLEIYAELQSILANLSSWSGKYSNDLWGASRGNNEAASLKSKILLIQHALLTLEASTSLYAEETLYDQFYPEFLRIITLAIEIKYNPLLLTSYSTDVFGVVKPLFVTILKCRNRALRCQALNILTANPRQEGVWSSIVMASIAKAVTDLEEQYRVWNYNQSHIPEQRRIHSVVSNIDYQNKTAVVECKSRPNGMDGEWEITTIIANWKSPT